MKSLQHLYASITHNSPHRDTTIHFPLYVLLRPTDTVPEQQSASSPLLTVDGWNDVRSMSRYVAPDTDPAVRKTKKWLHHPEDLPSVGAAVRRRRWWRRRRRWRWRRRRAFDVCAAAAAPALMQPRTSQPPVILLSPSAHRRGAATATAFQNKSPHITFTEETVVSETTEMTYTCWQLQ